MCVKVATHKNIGQTQHEDVPTSPQWRILGETWIRLLDFNMLDPFVLTEDTLLPKKMSGSSFLPSTNAELMQAWQNQCVVVEGIDVGGRAFGHELL